MWNIKQTTFDDGSSVVMFSDYAFGIEKSVTRSDKDQTGCSIENSSTEYIYEIKKNDVHFSDRQEADKERSNYESVRRSRQNVEIIGRANRWKYFITLTFNPDKVDSFSYKEVTKYIERWLDRMRKRYPDMKSLIVFEKHKSGRWHAHGLLAECSLILKDSGKKVRKTHDTIYNMPDDYEYGFTTVTFVRSSAAAGRYISKYIGKALGEVPENAKRYWASRNCITEKDCTVKRYVLDRIKNALREFLSEICVRKTESYIPVIDNTVTYYHLPSYLDINDLIEQMSSAA